MFHRQVARMVQALPAITCPFTHGYDSRQKTMIRRFGDSEIHHAVKRCSKSDDPAVREERWKAREGTREGRYQ